MNQPFNPRANRQPATDRNARPANGRRAGRAVALATAAAGVSLWAGRAAAQAAAPAAAPAAATPAKPNVIMFLVDDMGFSDSQAYGGDINTPNIDALAANGLQFNDFYVHPRCSPSRAALLTGQQNQAVGFNVLAGNGIKLTMNNVMIPEVLKANGYDTYMSGKWHLGDTTNFGTKGTIPGDQSVDPRVRGFDSAFTYIDSNHSENVWDPSKYRLLSNQVPQRTYTTSPGTTDYTKGSTFYQPDVITDYALDFINHTRDDNAANGTSNPYFEYVAYGSPHFPLGAPKTLVDSYVAQYSVGWDNIRADRLQDMIAKGVIPKNVLLTPRSDVPASTASGPLHQIPSWASLANPDGSQSPRQADLVRRMAVYAAEVDEVDQNIGRVIADLKSHGELDNTLVMFASDNGGNYESDEFGATKDEPIRTGTDLANMGTNADTGDDIHYGAGWASVSNTPFKEYKHFTYEGGVKSEFILDWNDGLASKLKGTMTSQVTQINDIMPTLFDTLGIQMPTTWTAQNGTPYAVKPLDATSTSMANYLATGVAPGARDTADEHEGNRYYRSGDFKIVYNNFTQTDHTPGNTWLMFNMATDPTETVNVSAQNPRLFNQLVSRWSHWANRNFVTAALPTLAPLAITPGNKTLFLDQFGRSDSNSLGDSSVGQGGTLVGAAPWVEAYEGGTTGTSASHADSIGILGTQLRMANGVGMANGFLDHNFNDTTILNNGGMKVSMMVTAISTTAGSDTANRFAGFGLGLTRAQAVAAGDISSPGAYRGTVGGTSSGVADFFVDLDVNGNLRVWHDGAVTALAATGIPYGEVEVDFQVSSFAAGAAVPYKVYLDGQAVSTLDGMFTWDQANSDYFGVSARASNYVLMDNLEIAATPEPTSLLLAAVAAAPLALGRRRRRPARQPTAEAGV